MKPLNILFVAELAPGSRSYQRIRRLKLMGHSVETLSLVPPDATYETRPRLIDRIRHRLRYPQDRSGANDRLRHLPSQPRPDIVWFERATTVPAATLRAIKQSHPDCKLIWYAEDDMMNPAHLSRQVESAVPWYDLWVTTKSFNTRPDELPSLGAKSILFVNNAYDIDAHSPIDLSDEDRQCFGSDISFVGTWEHPRAETVRRLAEAGLSVRIWGNGWERMANPPASLDIAYTPVYGDDYRRVICASKINLCFLRRGNRDLQTCRSFEIPAIGGFMIHEFSVEMSKILPPSQGAVYFDNETDLPGLCRFWLDHTEKRKMIAETGRSELQKAGHEHEDRLREILEAAVGKGG
ncbi:MAG: glycosyltransferase [Rhodospirillales bacterium]